MPRFEAWGQGSGAPAHLQLVQGPTGTGRSEGGEAHIANLITAQADVGAISQRPVPKRRGESGDSLVPNLFLGEAKQGQIENV